VWDPAQGALGWAVSAPYVGHTASVEDLQWSPAEPTVFASASADGSVRVWDSRAAPKRGSMLCRPGAHASDVNVLSWNRLVGYMLASGGDDGALRVWDLRTFSGAGATGGGGGGGGGGQAAAAAAPATTATTAAEPVAHFAFHRAPVTSVEWSPYEGSMLATAAADDQVAVWDLALERDPEEEAAAAAAAGAGAAAPPPDLPPQLLFVHAGQKDIKELRWHPQIPGMLVTTAADGFNAFRPSNL
jgi:ribosome assembly protein RRB1